MPEQNDEYGIYEKQEVFFPDNAAFGEDMETYAKNKSCGKHRRGYKHDMKVHQHCASDNKNGNCNIILWRRRKVNKKIELCFILARAAPPLAGRTYD
jgi:hypothetical protein